MHAPPGHLHSACPHRRPNGPAQVDRYNLLRVFKPPPRTTDRTVTLSVLYILPIAIFLHIFMAIFFYSNQVRGVTVPLLYYVFFALLAVYVMVRISAELAEQRQHPIKEPAVERDPSRAGWEAASGADPDGWDAPVEAGGELSQPGLLGSHLGSIELYVPPLTSTLLGSIYEQAMHPVNGRRDAALEDHEAPSHDPDTGPRQ